MIKKQTLRKYITISEKNKQTKNNHQKRVRIKSVRFGTKMNRSKIEIIIICFEASKNSINNDIITALENYIKQMSQLILTIILNR